VDVAPAELVAGYTATLTCSADNANPPARLSWSSTSHDGHLQAALDSAAAAAVVREWRTAGEHGGSVVVSRVELRLSADDDRRTVACLANGTATVTSQLLQLNVRCTSLSSFLFKIIQETLTQGRTCYYCYYYYFFNLGRSSRGERQKLILEIIALMVNHPSGSHQQSSRAAG